MTGVISKINALAPLMIQMKRDENACLFYSILADGLYWSDEYLTSDDRAYDELVRCLIRYRTSLILGEPEKRLTTIWSAALKAFPGWIGFIPERTHPSSDLRTRYEIERKKAFEDFLEGLEN